MAFLRRLEVPNNENPDFKPSRWINADITPLPPTRRTWTGVTFMTWWSIWQLSISSFQLGASLVSIGLSVWQAMLAVILSRVLLALVAVLNGLPGSEWHVGYPVFSRSVWGIWGAYIPMVIRLFLTFIAFTIQTFVGGLCITAILGAIFPTFLTFQSTIPPSANVTAPQLIGWIIFCILSGVLLYMRPEKSNRAILIMSSIAVTTLLGITIWALASAHGGGPLLSAPAKLQPGSDLGYSFLNAISVGFGSTSIAALGQADFSRFARTPKDQIAGQWISFCLVGVIVPLFGCLTASATAEIYGTPIWNPPVLALTWLEVNYNAPARAGAFFVGLGLVCSQLGITVVDAGYTAGMDMAGIFPRFVNIRRGSYFALIIGMLLFPWDILASAQTFTSVIGSFNVFIGPILGINIADYCLVRQKKLKLSHLYDPRPDGIYYFSFGVNWRTILSWVIGFVPTVPGLVVAANPKAGENIQLGLLHLYQLNWLYGLLVGATVHYVLNKIFPPVGLGRIDQSDIFGTFTEHEASRQLDVPAGSSSSLSDVRIAERVATISKAHR